MRRPLRIAPDPFGSLQSGHGRSARILFARQSGLRSTLGSRRRPEKPAQRLSRAACALLLALRQILLGEHDGRRCPPDFAVMKKRKNFPLICAALFRRDGGPHQRRLPVWKRNRRIFRAVKRLGGAHSPVGLSSEPKVNSFVYPNSGMRFGLDYCSITCAAACPPNSARNTAFCQGVKPELSSGE